MSANELRAAITKYIDDTYELPSALIKTDFVVVLGYAEYQDGAQSDGVFIVNSDGLTGYTQRGLLHTALEVLTEEE